MTNTLAKSSETLPDLKIAELERLEKRVREGLKSFMEVGQALVEIRERKGYALRGYKDFSDYCQKELGITERHGFRLMDGYQTAEQVKKVTGEAPRNEASARVLKTVANDPKLLGKLKDRLAKSKQTIATATAEKLQEVVDQIKPQTRAMFGDGDQPTPAERAAAPLIKSLSDACPKCKQIPNHYHRAQEGWFCGNCNAPVRVNVVPFEIVLCKECQSPIVGDEGFCRKCGSVQDG